VQGAYLTQTGLSVGDTTEITAGSRSVTARTIVMVLGWVAGPAVAAAVIAIRVGMLLRTVTVNAMARAAYTGLPASFQTVYRPAELVLLALSALVIGAVGALLPATWAARSRTAVALRAE
jgi:putative ABC transport system permease protein